MSCVIQIINKPQQPYSSCKDKNEFVMAYKIRAGQSKSPPVYKLINTGKPLMESSGRVSHSVIIDSEIQDVSIEGIVFCSTSGIFSDIPL